MRGIISAMQRLATPMALRKSERSSSGYEMISGVVASSISTLSASSMMAEHRPGITGCAVGWRCLNFHSRRPAALPAPWISRSSRRKSASSWLAVA